MPTRLGKWMNDNMLDLSGLFPAGTAEITIDAYLQTPKSGNDNHLANFIKEVGDNCLLDAQHREPDEVKRRLLNIPDLIGKDGKVNVDVLDRETARIHRENEDMLNQRVSNIEGQVAQNPDSEKGKAREALFQASKREVAATGVDPEMNQEKVLETLHKHMKDAIIRGQKSLDGNNQTIGSAAAMRNEANDITARLIAEQPVSFSEVKTPDGTIKTPDKTNVDAQPKEAETSPHNNRPLELMAQKFIQNKKDGSVMGGPEYKDLPVANLDDFKTALEKADLKTVNKETKDAILRNEGGAFPPEYIQAYKDEAKRQGVAVGTGQSASINQSQKESEFNGSISHDAAVLAQMVRASIEQSHGPLAYSNLSKTGAMPTEPMMHNNPGGGVVNREGGVVKT